MGAKPSGTGTRATAEAMVLFKVGVSCYAAVLSDAKLKGFSRSSAMLRLLRWWLKNDTFNERSWEIIGVL